MFCSKCGNEILDEAVICPKCGCSTGKSLLFLETSNRDDKVTTGLIILSVIIPIAGVVLGIVNLCKNKTKSGTIYLLSGVITWTVLGMMISLM